MFVIREKTVLNASLLINILDENFQITIEIEPPIFTALSTNAYFRRVFLFVAVYARIYDDEKPTYFSPNYE